MRGYRKDLPRTTRLGFFILLILIISIPYVSTVVAAAQQSTDVQATGTIKVTKSVPRISPDNKVSIELTVLNNGTVPVFDFEIFEYMNSNLQLQGGVTVTEPSGQTNIPAIPGGLSSAVQVIIDPPAPNILMPGQKLTLRYIQVAPAPGEFQIPTALIWFSYKYVGSTVRLSIYSNGLLVHVASNLERAVFEIYPYVLSVTTFTSTITILLWARNRLAKIRK